MAQSLRCACRTCRPCLASGPPCTQKEASASLPVLNRFPFLFSHVALTSLVAHDRFLKEFIMSVSCNILTLTLVRQLRRRTGSSFGRMMTRCFSIIPKTRNPSGNCQRSCKTSKSRSHSPSTKLV